MWVLMMVGGGIVVNLLGPITIAGFGDLNWLVASVIKAAIALILVLVWIVTLSKLKNFIFRQEIGR